MPTGWPATDRLAFREVVELLLEVTVTLMVALPVPKVGATEAQGTGLEAVQVQLAPLAVTARVPALPPLPKGLPELVASTVTLQGDGS